MVEPVEPMPGSFGLLDGQVEGFGGAVGGAGAVMVEDLGAPAPEGVSEAADLGDVVVGAADDRLVEEGGGVVGVVGEVDVSDGFLGQSGAADLVVGVTDSQAQQHPLLTRVVEAFGAFGEELADPIQRVGLASPVAKCFVLDPAAALIELGVCRRFGSERGVMVRGR